MGRYAHWVIAAVFILNSCMDVHRPLVIGHRGAMGHETENTLASVQKALDLGVDGIEIDVFRISTGETVVFHDDTVDDLTDGTGEIEEYTLENLQKLTLEGGHSIPLLEAVMQLIDNKVLLNIELKGAGTAKEVHRIVKVFEKDHGWDAQNIIISSFNWDELRDMRTIDSEIAIAVLTEENPLDAIAVAKTLGAVAINPDFTTLDLEICNTIRDAGFKIYTWTVNTENYINGAKRWGVDGIITNYPERVR